MPEPPTSQNLGHRAVSVGGNVSGDVVTGVKIVIHQGVKIAIPNAEAIATHRAALRERLTREAQARWGGMGVYIQEEGAALPIEASPYQQGRLGPRANLLETLKQADRLLVLGEPGAGKTVALERLAWELCNGNQPTVPVLVRLFRYAGTPLTAWLRDMLRQTGQLRLDNECALEAFLAQGAVRCVFLLDGLNEVAPPYRDRLVDEVTRWLTAHPRHAAILTSRAQDELWRRLRDAVGEAVVVQPITNLQAQDYLAIQLPDRGVALYASLDKRLRALARRPLLLWLIKEAGTAGESLPGNRGELYARFVSRMLRRDTDRRMDAEIPEAHKLGALTTLAEALNRASRLICPRAEAVALVAREWGDRAEMLLQACERHGLLAGDEQLWFVPHQTVQEHFAARALQMCWEREQQLGWRRGIVSWFKQEPSIVKLANDDWWAETFVQTAGLVTDVDADALAQVIVRQNPWLALWCLEEGRVVCKATRDKVEARSVKLLESSQVAARRRAVTALANLRNERVVAPLFRAVGDVDVEIAQIALEALSEFDEILKPLVLAAFKRRNQVLWRAALRWLPAQPDKNMWQHLPPELDRIPFEFYESVWKIALVYVPAGLFLMGSNKMRDLQAYDDELPQHEIMLSGYWIGKYPVTVAQFRTFVRESKYKWEGAGEKQGANNHPVVFVTWYDALAYCQWLAQKTGLPVTLPSEAEWEKAASWEEGNSERAIESKGRKRIYPWGAEFDKTKCNMQDSNVGKTTSVGQYSPHGDSPYGCADMVGNVWEWTRSHWKDYPYSLTDGREELDAGNDTLRVVRGAPFNHDITFARCACRINRVPALYSEKLGFRVVVSPSVL